MYPKKVARDTARMLQSYLTYQAILVIVNQLGETNPGQAIWLRQYSASHKLEDSEAYLDGLMAEHKELVLRILTVRESLAESVLDLLPEITRAGIQNANVERRRQVLERLTQTATPASVELPVEAEADEGDREETPPDA
ncbi:MAG: RbcX chaperonin protein [Spirulinaceae cyanobacterium SM2_1_0]|nr:RbcX chaperonin protein [Spirulinaceae cyanobacterium SM2_1_0]